MTRPSKSSDKLSQLRVLERSGRLAPEDEEPIVTRESILLTGIFFDLDAGRTSSGFGPNPITYESIFSYTRLHRLRLTPWQVGMLKRMDALYLKAWMIAQDAKDGGTRGIKPKN